MFGIKQCVYSAAVPVLSGLPRHRPIRQLLIDDKVDTTLVTGYIPLQANGLYRSHDNYRELGQRLLNVGLPTMAFVDPDVQLVANHAATLHPSVLESCWLINQARFAKLPPTDNPGKDTAEFLAVQLQKSHWVAAASILCPSSTFIWLDFGILHVPGAEPHLVREFYERVVNANITKITMASIWPNLMRNTVWRNLPSWYFAGGAFIVPRDLCLWFANEVERQMLKIISETGSLTWEINVWAEIAQQNPDKFATWPCDHDATMFTGFVGASECATLSRS
jgi:hypothetical protein